MSAECSALSLELGEGLEASAPSERGILVLEEPGPWGRDALRDCGLDAALAGRIESHATAAGLRIQMIRRSQARYDPAPRSAWLACVTPGRRFLEALELLHPEDILDVDVSGVAEGRPSGAGVLEHEPLHLVCTHGRRDACCARLGRPLWRALGAAAPGRVWQTSHLGGHRFAATSAILPLGVWLGRVPAARALEVAKAARDGRAPIELLRGRAGLPPAAQAADAALRRELDLDRIDDVEVLEAEGDRVVLAAKGTPHAFTARKEPTGTERPLSCGEGAKVEDPGRWVVAAVS